MRQASLNPILNSTGNENVFRKLDDKLWPNTSCKNYFQKMLTTYGSNYLSSHQPESAIALPTLKTIVLVFPNKATVSRNTFQLFVHINSKLEFIAWI